MFAQSGAIKGDDYIGLPGLLASKRVSDYLTTRNSEDKVIMTGAIREIVTIDPGDIEFAYTLHNLPREWYYLRVASLDAQPTNPSIWQKLTDAFASSSNNTHHLRSTSSPWTRQQVAGQQNISDTQ